MTILQWAMVCTVYMMDDSVFEAIGMRKKIYKRPDNAKR